MSSGELTLNGTIDAEKMDFFRITVRVFFRNFWKARKVKLTLDYGFGKRQTSEDNTRTRTHARFTGRATREERRKERVLWAATYEFKANYGVIQGPKMWSLQFFSRSTHAPPETVSFLSIGQASEVGDPTSNSTALVLITVLDTNDNPPEFFQSSYHFSIREDLAEPGYIVTDQLNVQDKDINVSNRRWKQWE